MDYLVAVLTLLILAFLYWRMIKREIPDPIKPFQAILPFAFGILSQTMIIHMIRTSKIPFVESKSSKELLISFKKVLIFFVFPLKESLFKLLIIFLSIF